MQGIRSNQTTNPIDTKIRIQIASIEVYLLGFFFNVCSAFTGRFQSILAMIRDESYLNMIAIEFRMQGDHEELKILLQNLLISSRFNQKLGLQRKSIDEAFYAVAKTHKRRSKKIYNSELTITKI